MTTAQQKWNWIQHNTVSVSRVSSHRNLDGRKSSQCGPAPVARVAMVTALKEVSRWAAWLQDLSPYRRRALRSRVCSSSCQRLSSSALWWHKPEGVSHGVSNLKVSVVEKVSVTVHQTRTYQSWRRYHYQSWCITQKGISDGASHEKYQSRLINWLL